MALLDDPSFETTVSHPIFHLKEDTPNLRCHDTALLSHFGHGPDFCSQVLTDITNTLTHDCSRENRVIGAPQSEMAVSSSHPSLICQNVCKLPPRENIMQVPDFTDSENFEAASVVQIGKPVPVSLKNSPIDVNQAYQLQAFQEGQVPHDDIHDDTLGSGNEDSEGYSPGDGSAHSEIQLVSSENARQEVILYHLDDNPIRAFISWNSYEEMITEIAHHYGLRREEVEEAHEVVVAPPDIGNDIVPTIVHVFGDIPPISTERLVLVDIEYHAHRIEQNFRSGPNIYRSVKPIPQTASRNEVLSRAIDRYCRSEGGRCLVFIKARRWPDYDLDRKVIAHGDYIRIAVPPSDRFACSTVALSGMTQRGLSDQQIIVEIYNDDAASGFSPSLLGEQDVRALATNCLEEDEELWLMQTSTGDRHTHVFSEVVFYSNSSSTDSVEQDWFVDLQRYAAAHFQQCDHAQQEEFMFSIYTWFIDQENNLVCREPKIAILGDDPSEWREEILLPWDNHLIPGNTVLIDLVQPFVPRASVEEHIAHVILTQRPRNLNSVLFSIEFVDEVEPSVIVRFAVAVPNVCTARAIADLVLLFDAFFPEQTRLD